MGSNPIANQPSTVLVDESFASADERFVALVREVMSPTYLAALADRWKKDPRPWARRQIFEYLAQPLDRPGHNPLVKRLFKQAEANNDHELMAAFLVAFDRLVRRRRRIRYRWDPGMRQSSREEELFSPRDQILPPPKIREVINPRTGQRMVFPCRMQVPKGGRLFSHRTRGYLRRRANRYFRRMGFQKPADYARHVASALAMYRDEDLATGESILDNWSLMSIAFRRSAVLKFSRTQVGLADGQSLAELAAAPQFDGLWKKPEAAAVLLKLVTGASSRLVRVWAIQLLRQHHAAAMQTIDADQLLALLNHADEEVQQFGAGLLDTLAAVESWSIDTWLRLLQTRSLTALGAICEAMGRRVKPERLELAQCVALACARATPVARLGLLWLKGRGLAGEADRPTTARLGAAQCEAVSGEIAEYALAILAAPQSYRTEDVAAFFDSLNARLRQGAWDWLTPQSAGYDDAALWSRLLETPYDDVRIRLVEELNKRTRGAEGPARSSGTTWRRFGRPCFWACSGAAGRSSRRCGKFRKRWPSGRSAPSN